jgi:hypothetical protein
METAKSIRKDFHNLDDSIIDAEIWKQDSQELHDLAEMIVNRHDRFAWVFVGAWCTKHEQLVMDIDKKNKGE